MLAFLIKYKFSRNALQKKKSAYIGWLKKRLNRSSSLN